MVFSDLFKSNDDEVESIDTNNLLLYDSLLALFSQPPSTATALTTSTTTIITHPIITTSIAPESSRPQRTKKLTIKAVSQQRYTEEKKAKKVI